MKKPLLAALAAAGLVIGALGSPAPAQGSLLEASVVPFQPGSVEDLDYSVQSAAGDPLGSASSPGPATAARTSSARPATGA